MTARHLPPPLMVAAVRHLRGQGWHRGPAENPEVRITDGHLGIDWSPQTAAMAGIKLGAGIWIDVLGRDGAPQHQSLFAVVTSVQQAVDHLVTAGVLPPELHSIARQYVPAVDSYGSHAHISPDGEVELTDGVFAKPADGWEPLYRRVVAS